MAPKESDPKVIALIPARLGSARLPRKPLAPIAGIPMVIRTYRQVATAGIEAYIVTDSSEIVGVAESHGCRALLSEREHPNGTSRCAEALEFLSNQGCLAEGLEVVINVQGDEPFVNRANLERLASLFQNPHVQIGTLARPFLSAEDVTNPAWPKVVLDANGDALYFSRARIPAPRDVEASPSDYLKHIGLYAFRPALLSRLVALPPAPPERLESLEQLRWLWNGYRIRVAVVSSEDISVDTPEDLARANHFAESNHL